MSSNCFTQGKWSKKFALWKEMCHTSEKHIKKRRNVHLYMCGGYFMTS